MEALHDQIYAALGVITHAIPEPWRSQRVDRDDLDRFLFERNDLVVCVGQDGLVANLAKYLDGQPVIGVNPLPECYDGILVPHAPGDAEELIRIAGTGKARLEARTMVAASRLEALLAVPAYGAILTLVLLAVLGVALLL